MVLKSKNKPPNQICIFVFEGNYLKYDEDLTVCLSKTSDWAPISMNICNQMVLGCFHEHVDFFVININMKLGATPLVY